MKLPAFEILKGMLQSFRKRPGRAAPIASLIQIKPYMRPRTNSECCFSPNCTKHVHYVDKAQGRSASPLKGPQMHVVRQAEAHHLMVHADDGKQRA